MTDRCPAEYVTNAKSRLLGQIGTSIILMQKLLMSMERFLGVSLGFGILSFKNASEKYLRFTVT